MQKKHMTAKQREQLKREKNKALAEKYAPKAPEPVVQDSADSFVVNKSTEAVAAAEKSEKSENITRRPATKTKAKAMGHKSTLVFGGKVVVTSFADSRMGKQGYKSANIEKVTDFSGYADEECERLSNPRMFNTNITPSSISLKKDEEQSTTSNPAAGNVGMDYIGLKSSIEKRVFGAEYSNDSLHIQIAYNIFDIKKILATYINNIIYIFYNLNRGKVAMVEKSDDDIIGMLYAFADIDAQQKDSLAYKNAIKFLEGSEPYYVYFGDIFKVIKATDTEDIKDDKIAKNFNVLRMLAYTRNLCMHGLIDEKRFSMSDSALFDIKRQLRQGDLLELLDDTYGRAITKINKDFVANSGNNLYVLSKIYAEYSVEELAEIYYKLNIVKDSKNLGINMTQLREGITSEYHKEVADKEFDTYRSKLYTVFNFILYKALCDNDSLREDMVNELRANRADEEGKLLIYNKYAKAFEQVVGSKFVKAAELLKNEVRGKFANKVNFDIKKCNGVLSEENTDYFVKLLYFISKFLDGKEINELFCSMINKFDNIADLIETARPFGEIVQFRGDAGYKLFLNSREIGRQLRVAKNLAAMNFSGKKKSKNSSSNSDDATYKEAVYLDALSLLGYDITKFKTNNDRIVKDENGSPVPTEQYKQFRRDFFETPLIKDGNYVYKKGVKQFDHKMRNFIINNVLKSKWFFYVVKYNSPSKCSKLMSNKNLLKFVMRDIPDEQIQRYYKTVTGSYGNGIDANRMREKLVGALAEFSVGSILKEVGDMSERENKEQREGSRKEKMKGIVRLYLTVAYLITKSMVKVNTRFSIAYSTLERDYYFQYGKPLLYAKVKKDDNNKIISTTESHVLDLTKRFVIRDKKIMEKWKEQYTKIAAIPKDDAHKAERKAALRENDKKLKDMHYTTRYYKYISDHLKVVDENGWDKPEFNMYTFMRNSIMHLNVINRMSEPKYIKDAHCNTYYGLYCYILQIILFDNTQNPKLREYINAVQKSGKYSKDLMWYLNLPFAYNLARYKNLSMEALFYDEFNGSDNKE